MQQLVIISGHSRGLGKALAEHYLAKGSQVIGLARKNWLNPPAALQQFEIDFSDEEALLTWLASNPFSSAIAQADEVILINNAGLVEPNALIGQQSSQAIVNAIKVNITAPLLLTNAVVAVSLGAQKPLRIVHISSGAGRKAYSGWSVYGATKAALDQHAEVIATEKRPQVRIASIAPGVVNTDMQAQIRASDHEQFPLRQNFIGLYDDKQLQTAADTAHKIAAMIAAENFGEKVKRDVRE